MSALVGKWTYDRSENFEEFLTAQGIGWMKRKLITNISPTQDISDSGEEGWTIQMITPVMTKVTKFKIGEPFENADFEGKNKRMMVASLEYDKLVIQAVDSPEENTIITREIVDGGLVMSMKKGDVVAKRYFKKAT